MRPTLRHLRGYLACHQDVCLLLAGHSLDYATRQALGDRRAQYRLDVRRILDACPKLFADTGLSDAERAELEAIRRYPLAEKIANGWRCLRDHGVGYTVKRIFFGRRS